MPTFTHSATAVGPARAPGGSGTPQLHSSPDAGTGLCEGGLRSRGNRDTKPLITVITVVFNAAELIEATILSVLEQSCDSIEYIVIDGGSSDGTLDIIRRYDHAIDYWASEPDNGIYDAMNKGLSLASGQWVNFMNAGDSFSEKTTVQDVFSEISDPAQYDCIYSDTLFNCRSGFKLISCDIEKRRFIHQSIIYKKELHAAAGPYLVAQGVSISDYLFFMVNRDRKWLKSPFPIARYSPYGLTSGSDAFKQKIAVDVMLGCTGRVTAALMLLVHPLYHQLKRLLAFGSGTTPPAK